MMFREFFRGPVVTSDHFDQSRKILRYLLIVKHIATVFPAA